MLDDSELSPSTNFTYFGVIQDSKCDFSKQINSVCSKVSSDVILRLLPCLGSEGLLLNAEPTIVCLPSLVPLRFCMGGIPGLPK